MSNTAEIIEVDNGYEVTAQNIDGRLFLDSVVVEDDAFEHITSHVQEEGISRYDAEEGYEFILEGEQLVGARVGYLHCVEESQEETFSIPYRKQYTFSEMVSELGVPETEQAYDELNYVPPIELEVSYDKSTGDSTPLAVKVGGKRYELAEE